jgi:hypothetical protein
LSLIAKLRGKDGSILFVPALLLVTVIVLWASLSSTWMSDDYVVVYGIYGNPVKTLIAALSRSTSGLITPHRMFLFWFLGIGGILGPVAAHALAVMLHILCIILFWGLVWRLFHSSLLAALAASWFALAPWISEPELWWTALCTTISSILVLTAAHAFRSSIISKGVRSLLWSLLASCAAFLSLCFYDLWIAGFAVFFGIWVLRGLELNGFKGITYWRSTWPKLGVMAAPYVLWAGWVAVAGPYAGAESRLNLDRIPITFASIHLRVANWFVPLAGGKGPDWLTLWRMGFNGLSAPALLAPFVIGMVLIVFAMTNLASNDGTVPYSFGSYASTAPANAISGNKIGFPWRILFFSWMLFLASRLVIVLQGGTALESRLNYGAAMAAALAVASLACCCWRRWSERSPSFRWLASIGYAGSILLMAAATAGQARHFALVTQAEAYTFSALTNDLKDHPEIRSLVVSGTPVPNIGELDYFYEANGFWLETVLRKLGYQTTARVTQSTDPSIAYDADAVFVWSGQWPHAQLQRLRP